MGNKIEGLEELFKKFIFDFNQILTKQENNTELLNQKWDEAIRSNSEFNGKVSDVTSELKEGVPMMKQAAENINQAASKLGTFQESLSIEIDKFQKEFSEIRNAMNLAAGEISNSTDKLGEIPKTMDSVIRNLESSLESLMESLKDLNGSISGFSSAQVDLLKDWEEQSKAMLDDWESANQSFLNGMNESISNTLGANKKTIDQMKQNYDDHLDKIKEELKSWIEEFGKKVGGQTRERLESWDEGTAKFSENMVSASDAINSSIETLKAGLEDFQDEIVDMIKNKR